MLIRALILGLVLAAISAVVNEARSITITADNYQKIETYYSLVNPKVELKCNAPIPYLRKSTIRDNGDGTFTVIVSFICGRTA